MPWLRLFLLALSLAGAMAQAAPQFPPLSGRVVDAAKVLPPAARAQLTEALAQHEQTSGQQVVVATVPSLQGYAIEDYGVALGRHWGIGQKKENTGAILLVAIADRAVRIEVGYGLEGVLTDAVSNDIIQRILLPAFKQGDMAGGIVRGTEAILATLGGEAAAAPPPEPEQRRAGFPIILLPIILFIIFSRMGRRRHGLWNMPWGGGGFGGGGGGGFSGGGGSFGGGGASGRW